MTEHVVSVGGAGDLALGVRSAPGHQPTKPPLGMYDAVRAKQAQGGRLG